MKKALLFLTLLLLLIGRAEPGRAQSCLESAQALDTLSARALAQYQRAAAAAPNSEASKAANAEVSQRCLRYFQVLAANLQFPYPDTVSVPQVYEAYLSNPFLNKPVREMYGLWLQANVGAGTPLASSTVIQDYNNALGVVRETSGQYLRYWLSTATPAQQAALNRLLTAAVAAESAAVRAEVARDPVNGLMRYLQSRPLRVQPAIKAILDSTTSPAPLNSLARDLFNTWDTVRVPNYAVYLSACKVIRKEVMNELKSISSGNGVRIGIAAQPDPYFWSTTGGKKLVVSTLGPAGGSSAAVSGRVPTTGPPADWQTTVLEGTARFVAERMKQEISSAVLEQLTAILNDPNYSQTVRPLFPTTCKLLKSGTNEYGVLLQTLRGAAEQDLRNLVFNAGPLLTLIPKTPAADDQRKAHIYFTIVVLRHIAQGRHPAELLSQLPAELDTINRKYPDAHWDAVLPTVNSLKLLSDVLLTPNGLEGGWAYPARLQAVLQRPRQLTYFEGLAFQRLTHPGAAAALSQPLQLALQQAVAQRDYAAFQKILFDFANLTSQFQQQVRDLNARADTARVQVSQMAALYQTTLATVRFAAERIQGSNSTVISTLADHEQFSELVVRSYIAGQQHRYGLAFANLVQLVNSLVKSDDPKYAELHWSQVVRYGSMLAAVGQAQTPEEAQHALEAAALPAGSYRLKRETLHSFSLSAYPGVVVGGELLNPAPAGNRLRPVLGFTAPLGFAYNWSRKRRSTTAPTVASTVHPSYVFIKPGKTSTAPEYVTLKGGCRGFFISVIDLGVPVLVRLQDKQHTTLPRYGFKEVFAPGLFYTLGVAHAPVAMLAGIQYTAQLRPSNANPAVQANSFRFSLSATVDIPMFNLGARTEYVRH